MKSTIALFALAATGASAGAASHFYAYVTSGGNGISTGGRPPNATSEVTFNRRVGDTDQEWKWRINITNVPIANDATFHHRTGINFSEGWLVNNMQWQLVWPGNSSLSELLAANGNLKMTLNSFTTPISFLETEGWDQPNDGDCTSLLGATCVENIQGAATSGGTYILDLPGCSDPVKQGSVFSGYWDAEQKNRTSFYSNETITSYVSNSFQPGDSKIYNEVTRALQLMTIDFQDESTYNNNPSGKPSVLCQIVDCVGCKHSSAASPLGRLTMASWVIMGISMLVALL